MQLLQPLLADMPKLLQQYETLAGQTLDRLMELVTGKNLIWRQSLRAELDVKRDELGQLSTPSPLISMAVELLLASWLEVTHHQRLAIQAEDVGDLQRVARYNRLRDAADRRHHRAIRTMAQLCRISPKIVQRYFVQQ
jgi:hypothetical protein